MKTITFPIISTEFIDELVKKQDNIVITKRLTRKTLKRVCFDVQIIRTHTKTRTFQSFTVNEGDEFLPSAAQWGQYGWSYPTLELAEKKLQDILNKKLLRG